MSLDKAIYCLDTNVLIRAWQDYYSPSYCPGYWDVLNALGKEGRIFMPKMVFTEITRVDDGLSKWLKSSDIPVHAMDAEVALCQKRMYEAHPDHSFITAEGSTHSMADPWVIAHAMHIGATVVTKEHKDVYKKPTKIKVPHICDNMNVRWVNDFQMIAELGIRFSCAIESK